MVCLAFVNSVQLKGFVYFVERSVATQPEYVMMPNMELSPEIFNTGMNEDIILPQSLTPIQIPAPPPAIPAPLPAIHVHFMPPAAKKHKVTSQDVQIMQMKVLAFKKMKIELEVENIRLFNEKMKLEIQELLSRHQAVNSIENNN
jgi:hypothetical protein